MSSIFADHAPGQATCPAQCYRDSFLSESGILPAQRELEPLHEGRSAALMKSVPSSC